MARGRRWPARLLGLLVASAAVLGIAVPSAGLAEAGSAGPLSPAATLAGHTLVTSTSANPKLGVYRGTSRAEVRSFATWLGRKPVYVADFKPYGTWNEIANPKYLNTWKGSGYRLVYGVPLMPTSGGTYKKGAAGKYDKYFKKLAQTLVADGQGKAILRIGWEFNIQSAPWKAAGPTYFKLYWRNVVKTMRSVKGAAFQFDWDVVPGYTLIDAAKYYPGADYVDYVGLDSYDESWQAGTYPYQSACTGLCVTASQDTAWSWILTNRRGLSFWSAFARARGKPLSFPEWGMWTRIDGHGGGDDPSFVAHMHAFMTDPANHVAYQVYFDVDADGLHELSTTLPEGGAVYRNLFGTGAG